MKARFTGGTCTTTSIHGHSALAVVWPWSVSFSDCSPEEDSPTPRTCLLETLHAVTCTERCLVPLARVPGFDLVPLWLGRVLSRPLNWLNAIPSLRYHPPPALEPPLRQGVRLGGRTSPYLASTHRQEISPPRSKPLKGLNCAIVVLWCL